MSSFLVSVTIVISLYSIHGFNSFLIAGEVIVDGTDFRNTAHLRFKADMFVPCGGRYVYSIHLSYQISYLMLIITTVRKP